MEDAMRAKSIMLTGGFLAMMSATVALSSSNSVITDAQRMDVIDTTGSQEPVESATSGSMSGDVIDSLPTEEGQLDGIQIAGEEKVMRVDVIDSLPTGWQWDSAKAAGEKMARVDVIDSVEWRGDVYASTSGSMRVDVIDNIRS
jgi:hypothetical protein